MNCFVKKEPFVLGQSSIDFSNVLFQMDLTLWLMTATLIMELTKGFN